MTLSEAIALTLFAMAVAWLIVAGALWMMHKLPTRSLVQQITRPSADDEAEDLAQITELTGRLFEKTVRLWPIALLSFLASIIVVVVR